MSLHITKVGEPGHLRTVGISLLLRLSTIFYLSLSRLCLLVSVCLSVRPSVGLSFRLSVRPSVRPSVCLSVWVCLSRFVLSVSVCSVCPVFCLSRSVRLGLSVLICPCVGLVCLRFLSVSASVSLSVSVCLWVYLGMSPKLALWSLRELSFQYSRRW